MTLSAGIQAKIIEIAKTLPSLKKEDQNGSYSYVSIDTYYEKIAKACLEAGLSWIPTELDFEIVEGPDGWPLQVQQYSFTLFTAKDIAEDAIKLSISHPFQDAQTTGSSLSYAEKLLMRVLFKVVTGEQDADAKAPRKKGGKKEDVENPFKPAAANDNEPPKEKKKPGQKPKPTVLKEEPAAGEDDEVEDRNTTANAIKKLEEKSNDDDGEPPWDTGKASEGDDGEVNLLSRTADDLLVKIEQCKNAGELDQFRLDNGEDIAWLKAEGAKSKEGAAQRDRVAAAFRAKFEEYNKGDD